MMAHTHSGRPTINPSDAVDIVPAAAATPVIVLCDHASNALPPKYGTLGLGPGDLARHIAYDIGAAGVVRAVAQRLGAAAVLSRWSRLLIDLNRGTDDPTLIMQLSDRAVIPGNRDLDAAERQARIAAYYHPYHGTIAKLIDQQFVAGITPVLLSIHSFTPIWRGAARPWHAAILWDRDPRLAVPLLRELRADPRLLVGDNEPYSGQLRGDTLWQHGTCRGLAHAIVEIRQDLIADETGQTRWGNRLADIMTSIIGCSMYGPPLRQPQIYGSHTGEIT